MHFYLTKILLGAALGLSVIVGTYPGYGQPSARLLSVSAQNYQKESLLNLIDSLSTTPVVLPYDQNTLSFTFEGTRIASRDSFLYMLKGLDYYWVRCNNCTQAQYAHLDGGEYTFLVKTTAPEAIPAEFRFEIEGTVWHRWWFVPMLVLYGVLLIGIGGYLLVLYRFRQKLIEQESVHKARMESMSELMTGIAHEILNPLNFVTNYSEINLELLDELQEELPAEALDKVKDIVDDVENNMTKIHDHSLRANGIVQSMLQHSRIGHGERQSVDLKKLITEHLQEAYQRICQQDSTFEAVITTDFDNAPLTANILVAEFSKVFQNIFSNSFYAMQEKRAQGIKDYLPSLGVSAHQKHTTLELRIWDNGTGIPQETVGKIFQPFFTTKPTGQGTGLGLSLCYDIITKGHNGKIWAETVLGAGSTFIVQIPA